MPYGDRRQRRSFSRHRALTYFLECEAQRRNARAIVLGTLDGLPIASWGTHDELQLSAAGAEVAHGRPRSARTFFDDVDAVVLDTDSGRLVVSCAGAPAPLAEEIAPHIARILD